jgi:hypothetical protein
LKREFEEVVDVVLLNLIYGVALLTMLGSLAVFLYGHFTGNLEDMNSAAHWGLIGSGLTVLFGFIRRLRPSTPPKENKV